jgi:signal transduction histidine kinase
MAGEAEPAGRDIAGRDTAGRDTAGWDTAGWDTAGWDTAGWDIAERDVAERLTHLWHGLFAATLAIPTAIALLSGDLPGRNRVAVTVLAGGFALLHWTVLASHPQWWQRRPAVMAGYWVVACGFVVLLASLHEAFVILLYGLFPLLFLTLGWWGVVPVVGLIALVGWARGGWDSGSGMVVNLLGSAALAVLIAAFVEAIARQSEQRRDALAALASARADLAASERQAGVLAERERLARELHDTVAQGFTSVVTQLESADQALDGRPVDAREHLEKARRIARDSLDELRRSVQALRPDLLQAASLTGAVQRVVRAWSADSGLPAELCTTGSPVPLRPDTELALLRTTQESLANVARHAGASRVVVSLSYLGDTVTLDVDDDGSGFDGEPHPRSDGGLGLIGMRERVEAAGGELTIESAPGKGTTIAVSVPT